MLNRPLSRRIALAVAVGALAVPASVIGAPDRDTVQGAGQNNVPPPFPINHFTVSASANPDGSDAKGFAQFIDTVSDNAPLKFRGDVLCLRVTGNVARLVMRITDSTNPGIPEGRLWRVDVEDNGKNTGGENVDEVRNGPITTVDCSGESTGVRTLTHGNIRVHDAS
jgi:hypothetical protein